MTARRYLILLSKSSVFPSIRVFSNALVLHITWPKYWSFSIFLEYSGLISFRIDRFELLVVQGTLKSLLQHHNLKAPILQLSAFFMVELSHLYLTTGKTIALTIPTFVSKVMSLSLSFFFFFDTWGWIILCFGGHLVRSRLFSIQDAK